MRISIFLLLVCAHVSANTFSQKVTLSGSNITLTQAFNTIKQQTGYSFFWDQQLLDKAPLISVSVKDVSIADALDKCLKGLPLSYEIKGKIAFITTKKKALTPAELQNELSAPIFEISGVITSDDGKPLQGATLTLIPLNMTAVSDASGTYRFSNIPVGHYTLEISYVGFEKTVRNFLIENKSIVLDAKMHMMVAVQEEVVVSTGYQKIKKASATGAYSVITSKEIEETPSPNIMERLEGKVPGVLFDVRNNKIQVRGVSSFGATSVAPLIVIDGFPYIDNQFTNITGSNFTSTSTNPINPGSPTYSGNSILSSFNPSDIESITFLKDAAASSIWGAFAANGVIVIETKKGRKNSSPTVNLSATYSTSKPADLSSVDAMSSKDYINFEQELFDKNFYADPSTNYRYAEVSQAVDWMFRAKRWQVTAARRDSALNALAGLSGNDQLKQYLLQKIVSQQYNLSVSGGGENNTYHLSGNYSKNNPVYKGNQAESYFVTSNTTNDFLNKRITLSTGLNYTYSKSKINTAALQGISAGSFGLAPYDMLTDANGNPIERGLVFTKYISDSLLKLGHLPWTYNPIDELNYNNTIYTKTAIRANVSLTGKITSWLSLQVSGQLQRNTDQQNNLQEQNSYAMRELINTGTSFVSGKPVYGVPKGAIYKSSNSNNEDYGVRAQLNANKSWKGMHTLNVLAGAEIRQTNATGTKLTKYGYDPVLGIAVAVNPTVSYQTMYPFVTRTIGYADGGVYKSRYRYLSYFSNATYSLFNKYFLSASARFDDYSLVGVNRDKRGTPLWSVGGKWDISKEKFMSNIKWLNNLSLRSSYGSSGSIVQGVSSYTVVSFGQVESYTQLPYGTIISPGNPTLTWQTTKTFNVGTDAVLFKNRLSVSVDVYNKHSSGIYAGFPINGTFGFTQLTYNASSMSGHGVEVNLTGQIIRTKNWNWSSNFNFSYNTNKVTDNRYVQNTSTSTSSNHLAVDYPTDNLFVYRWAGLDNTGQGQVFDAKGNKLQGKNFPVITGLDQVYAGRTTPPYFGGFTNTVQYKSWSLSARAVYNLGHKFLKNDIASGHYPTSSGFSGRLGSTKALVNRWRNPGDEAITNVPGITGVNSYSVNWYNGSDISVRDAGNIRLQQVTLGYNLPESLISRSFIKSASIAATASNLGIIWRKNKDGIDPDYVMTGDYNNLPPTVNYVIKLNLTF